MQLSEHGTRLLMNFEGLRLDAYQDTAGIWTIGIGDTNNVHPGMVITEAEATERLEARLEREFEPELNRQIGQAPTSQNQFDAMLLLSYNIGSGAFGRSSILRHHRDREPHQAAAAFLLYTIAGGRQSAPLLMRRRVESKLYLAPDAPTPKRLAGN